MDMERDRNSVSKQATQTKDNQCRSGEQSWGTDKYRGGNNRWWVSPGESNITDARNEGRQVCVMDDRSVWCRAAWCPQAPGSSAGLCHWWTLPLLKLFLQMERTVVDAFARRQPRPFDGKTIDGGKSTQLSYLSKSKDTLIENDSSKNTGSLN